MMGVVAADRRTVLRAASTVPWLLGPIAGCTAAFPPTQDRARADTGVVDVHCHLFNASDLPARGFVQRVVLGDPEHQVVLGPDTRNSRAALPYLAALLVELLSGPTPTAETELATIDGVGGRSVRAGLPGPASEADVARLRRALETVLEPAPERRAGIRAVDGQPPLEQGHATLVRAIVAEGAAVRGTATLRQGEPGYEAMARGLLAGKGVVSRYVQWALLLTRSRQELVERAVSLYGGDRGITLFTPALIDFSQWLDDEPRQGSGLEDQIRVMERIQRLPLGAAVHCFAPYDPWRQIVDEEASRRPSAFELVTWAVQEMGFVGIKLYPPMGFLPTGNAEVSQGYPARAQAILDFPRKLDAALNKLYAWAAEQGVAIMAHASNSNGAADEYSERANPRGWSSILARYPELRLNLAHFGGFGGRYMNDSLEGSWEDGVGQLIAAGHGNVYADVSYFSEILSESADGPQQRAMAELTAEFLRKYDPTLQHLMYGSDWIMLGLEENYEAYLTRILSLFRELAGDETQMRRFLAGNADRFLGLRPGNAARQRLDTYYRKHQLDPSWLARLAGAT